MSKKTAVADKRATSGAQKNGRAVRVVNSILTATGEELNAVGYAALKVEDVAERAGVNKTTIYRRWPTKEALVIEALLYNHSEGQQFIPDTGNLREDMISYIQLFISRIKDPIPRGVLVTVHNCTDPALKPVAEKLIRQARAARKDIIQRGIDRGELPSDTNAEIISDMFSAPILRRLLTYGEKIDQSYIEAIIDTVIAGAREVPQKRIKEKKA